MWHIACTLLFDWWNLQVSDLIDEIWRYPIWLMKSAGIRSDWLNLQVSDLIDEICRYPIWLMKSAGIRSDWWNLQVSDLIDEICRYPIWLMKSAGIRSDWWNLQVSDLIDEICRYPIWLMKSAGIRSDRWNLPVSDLHMSCSDIFRWMGPGLVASVVTTVASCLIKKHTCINTMLKQWYSFALMWLKKYHYIYFDVNMGTLHKYVTCNNGYRYLDGWK